MSFTICLRDLRPGSSGHIIEESHGIEDDLKDLEESSPATESIVAAQDEKPEESAMRRFIERASKIALSHNNIDIYIGCWNQVHTEIPYELFVLIVEKKWKVFLDIND